MKKYKVQLSIQAKNDYKSIIRYIKYELLEPIIAEKYAKLIKNNLIVWNISHKSLLLLTMIL